ncbi:MAG: pilus assembly protein PilM [Candidatus Hydrogenedentota bacterium]
MKLTARVGAFEFDGDTVRLAIVRTGGRLPTVLELHAAQASYDAPEQRFEALAQAARDVLGKVKTPPAVYTLSASSAYSVVRKMRMPFKGHKRVAAAVPFELEPYLAFPLEELVVDFTVMGEQGGQTDVLAVGMRVEHLEQEAAALEAAGAAIQGINLDVAGLTSLWMSAHKEPANLQALAHVRPNGCILAAVNNKRLVFFRHLSVDAAQFHGNPAAAAREIQNTLRGFLASWDRELGDVAALTVTGVELFEEERNLFESGFRIPVQYERLMSQLRGPAFEGAKKDAAAGGADKEAPEEIAGGEEGEAAPETAGRESEHEAHDAWVAPIGVAHAAAGGGFGFEFRKGPLARQNEFREYLRHAAFSGVLALIVLIGYAAFAYVDYRQTQAALEDIDRQMWDIYAEAFPEAADDYEPGEEPPYGWREAYTRMQEEIQENPELGQSVSAELFNMPTLLDVLTEISEAMPEGEVHITNLSIQGSRNPRIQLEGEVTDPQAFNNAFASLQESEMFTISEEPTRRVEGGRETFTITARR